MGNSVKKPQKTANITTGSDESLVNQYYFPKPPAVAAVLVIYALLDNWLRAFANV